MSAQIGNTPPTINISNPDELRWWAKEFGVADDHVRGAVSRVGNSAQAVREALKDPSPTNRGSSAATRYESSQERDGAMRWVLIAVVAASVAGAIVMMRRRRNQSWLG